MLKEFGPDIWMVDGPTVIAAAGFHYPTRMVLMRLPAGELVLWSPTALTDELSGEVDRLGTVRHLIAPNSFHHTFLADWQRTYPEATVYAAPGLREKRRDIRFDVDFLDDPIMAWAGQIDHAILWGNRLTTEVVFFHRPSRTAIFTDMLQQFPDGWFKGWRALIARLDMMTAPEPAVPRKFQFAFTDRQAARHSLEHILAWPAQQVIMAHGPAVTTDGTALLRRAFRWLS